MAVLYFAEPCLIAIQLYIAFVGFMRSFDPAEFRSYGDCHRNSNNTKQLACDSVFI